RTEWGRVDTLVNCAAIRLRAALTEISAEDFAEVLRVNLVGAFVLTKAVVPAMRERGGSIVHIGSALGSVAAPDFSPYVASKGGVHQLARAAAVELVQDEIRVNVVAPGTIDTAIGMGVPEFRRHLLKHRIPIGRAGHVSDVAAACLYLASDAARYVTGSVLAAPGGSPASSASRPELSGWRPRGRERRRPCTSCRATAQSAAHRLPRAADRRACVATPSLAADASSTCGTDLALALVAARCDGVRL